MGNKCEQCTAYINTINMLSNERIDALTKLADIQNEIANLKARMPLMSNSWVGLHTIQETVQKIVDRPPPVHKPSNIGDCCDIQEKS